MPTWIMRLGSISPFLDRPPERRAVEELAARSTRSHVSGCASKCTTASGPWRRGQRADDRQRHRVIAAHAQRPRARRDHRRRSWPRWPRSVRSIEIGTTSTSPQSATRSLSKGCTLSTGFHGRISEDCSRTARGPKRAPGAVRARRRRTAMPSRATSSPAGDSAAGRSMKVASWPNRGETNGSRGPSCGTVGG